MYNAWGRYKKLSKRCPMHGMKVFKVQKKFAVEDFGPVNLKKLRKTLFMILWYMHTNQQTIKKNYLNQIKEIFLASRVDNSRSFYFILFFFVFPDLPSCSSSLQGTCGRTD